MAGFGFRKHTVFDWDGTVFRIERLQPNEEILLEAVETGQAKVATRQQLLDAYVTGKLSALPKRKTPEEANPTYQRPLADLPEATRAELKRRQSYLKAIADEGPPVFTSAYLTPIIQRVAQAIGDSKPPSPITVYRWHRRAERTDDPRSLIPRYDRRGHTAPRQSARVLELLAESTADAFKTTPLATVRNIYSRFLRKIEQENQSSLGDALTAPCERTVYRLLAKADMYELVTLREGKTAADRRLRIGKLGVSTTRILERVEIDHTPLDLFLVDEHTWLPLGRPTLTVAIDHFSRFPLGYYLSFGAPSAAAVAGVLRHAILPKTKSEPVIRGLEIEHAWTAYGKPEHVVTDNGLEFHGVDLDSIALDLGFGIELCPKRQPRFKGVIERYLKTINYYFAHQLPGVSFARFHQRGDYDPQKHALLTLAEFKHLLEKWILDIYAQTVHSALGTTPWHKWHQGMASEQPILPESLDQIQQRLGLTASRKLRRDGFQIHSIRYNSDSLGAILRRYGEGIKIRVVFDPDDLGRVFAWGPDDESPIEVQALDLSYASGLSVRQHELIQQLAKENRQSLEDKASLHRAKGDLADAVSELMRSRKLRQRTKSAALRGISSDKPVGSLSTQVGGQAKTTKPQSSQTNPAEVSDISANQVPILPAFRINLAK